MHFRQVKRREFITLLGGAAAAWPLAARAQQPTMHVIGFLRSTPSAAFMHVVAAFQQGLKEEGFVESLVRPGGNLTGFLLYEESITGKWLAMLKEIAPAVRRAAIVSNPKTVPYDYFLHGAEAAAPSLGLQMVPGRVENTADIERTIESLAQVPDGGMVLPPDTTTVVNRDLIIALAARHRLPAIYSLRFFVTGGGLMSYGTDFVNLFRQAASYVDRILRGARPGDLPVQQPTKFETAINLKTARALGLTVPPGLLVAADEVIE